MLSRGGERSLTNAALGGLQLHRSPAKCAMGSVLHLQALHNDHMAQAAQKDCMVASCAFELHKKEHGGEKHKRKVKEPVTPGSTC